MEESSSSSSGGANGPPSSSPSEEDMLRLGRVAGQSRAWTAGETRKDKKHRSMYCVDALVGGGCLIQVPQRPPRVLAGVPAVFAPPRQR